MAGKGGGSDVAIQALARACTRAGPRRRLDVVLSAAHAEKRKEAAGNRVGLIPVGRPCCVFKVPGFSVAEPRSQNTSRDKLVALVALVSLDRHLPTLLFLF